MRDDHDLLPDLIFFSGDLAFGHVGDQPGERIDDQFDDGQKFLEQIRRTYTPEVPLENVFLVPGNHDVDRREATPEQSVWLDGLKYEEGVEEVTRLIQSGQKQWQRYMERLLPYKEFLDRHGYQHLLTDEGRLIYAAERTVGGLKLGIAGLNSAWSCWRDNEKGKLWCGGDWQIGALTSRLNDVHFRLAVMHHPTGWFSEYEEPDVRRAIERDFQFCLHGHEHEGWVNALADGHVRVAAAACYDRSRRENGYNFVRLDPNAGTGEVWLRRFDSSGGGWIPRVIAGKTDNNGRWPLDKLKWLRPSDAHGGRPARPAARKTEPQALSEQVISSALGNYHQRVQTEWDSRWDRVVGDEEGEAEGEGDNAG
jgi:predicted MPP superfamily phosphohydrolase